MDALDRIRSRVEAHTAAAPPVPAPANTPPEPVAPPEQGADLAGQVADLNEIVAGLAERVSVIEQAAVDDTLNEMDAWGEDPMMAALPTPGA